MGYSTDFSGSFQLSRPTTAEEKAYLDKLADTRRMQRDVAKLMKIYKGKGGLPLFQTKLTKEQKELVKQLEKSGVKVTATEIVDNRTAEEIYGFKGEYFVGADGFRGQDSDDSIIDYNAASGEVAYADYKGDWDKREEALAKLNADKIKQPGLWLQWVLNDSGTELEWNGGEKFYNYIEWLKYLVVHFFEPWGIKLNGEVEWSGEDRSDVGKIVVKDNVIEIYEGVKEYQFTKTL